MNKSEIIRETKVRTSSNVLNLLHQNHLLRKSDINQMVLNELENYKSKVELLNSGCASNEYMISIAIELRYYQRAFKLLKKVVSENEFEIFYMALVQGMVKRRIANILNIDFSTVYRAKKKCLNKLGLILFPDIHLIESLDLERYGL